MSGTFALLPAVLPAVLPAALGRMPQSTWHEPIGGMLANERFPAGLAEKMFKCGLAR